MHICVEVLRLTCMRLVRRTISPFLEIKIEIGIKFNMIIFIDKYPKFISTHDLSRNTIMFLYPVFLLITQFRHNSQSVH